MIRDAAMRVDAARYADYDPIAWYYDRYWATEYVDSALPILDKLVLERLPAAAPVLDLCCGSGHLTQVLAARGFCVTGLDRSERMLHYARRRAPAARFVLADARTFAFQPAFAASVSTFDSLNHVLASEDLIAVFRNVHRAVLNGGCLVFDLNVQEAYENDWGKSSAIVAEDHALIVHGSYDPLSRIGRTQITMFRVDDVENIGRIGTVDKPPRAWRRADAHLLQKCHSVSDICAALRLAGFRDVEASDARRDLGMTGRLSLGRTFFRARKP
jgi:SAM-dependent methyltransferase